MCIEGSTEALNQAVMQRDLLTNLNVRNVIWKRWNCGIKSRRGADKVIQVSSQMEHIHCLSLLPRKAIDPNDTCEKESFQPISRIDQTLC